MGCDMASRLSSTQILKDVTLFFSRAIPYLASVIPAMDKIDTEFTNYTPDKSLDPAIRASVQMAKKTLNRYDSLTDHSETYRIAMSKCLVWKQGPDSPIFNTSR